MSAAVTTKDTQALIQTQIDKVLTQPLEQASTFLSSGVRIVDSSSPVRFPKLDGDTSTIGYVGEGELIPQDDISMSELSLMPSSMKSFKRIIPVTHEALRTASQDLSAIIQNALVSWMTAKVDAAMFGGTGDGKTEIKGILEQATEKTTAGGKMSIAVVRNALAQALKSHVNPASLKLFVTPDDFIALQNEADAGGHGMLVPDATAGFGYKVAGVPIVVTDRLTNTSGDKPTGRAVLVDTTGLVVIRDIQSVEILKEALALSGQVGLSAAARFDVGILEPKKVIVIDGITR